MLPARSRLRKRRDFQRVFELGRYAAASTVTLHVLARGDNDPTRIGVAVGRKFGCIARRNHWKRLVKAACVPILHRLSSGFDMVLVARAPIAQAKADVLFQQVATLVSECGMTAREKR